ncbi:MAG TPA: VOC family protein [Anaerolineaceae bacterium]|nr:VOC family protein [Anaerolineaceae bacterium]
MNTGVRTILYPVKDIAKAKAQFSQLLGRAPDNDAPYYVGWQVGEQQIGLVPNGQSQGLNGPVGYYHVDDIHKSLESLLSAGAQVQQAVGDVGGGRLVASVKDADGNVIGLIQDTR